MRHWAAPILAAIWLGTVFALARQPRNRRRVGLTALVLGTGASYLVSSPLPGGAAFNAAEFSRSPREAALDRAVAVVPPEVPLAVSANLAAHVANRRQVFAYPIDEQYLAELEYEQVPLEAYLLDLTEPATQRVRPLSKSSPLTADPPFVVHSTSQKIMVLTRKIPEPEHPLEFRFGRRMVLLGYDLARSGSELRLTLHWWGDGTFSGDFRRVVELLDDAGRVLSDDPNVELTSTLPTQKWLRGQRVLDEIEFNLPSGADSAVRARVQWHNRDRRTPLRLPDGAPSAEFSF
jgi:hypothetical protein